MYEQLNCMDCLNYEYEDSLLDNNCIHYRFCIKDVEKTNKEIEKERVKSIREQINKYKELKITKTVSVATYKNLLDLLEETLDRLEQNL